MTGTIADVVKQFKNDWTSFLEPAAIRSACREAGHHWRERLLDPVVTLQLFLVQILHGNTACTHLRHLTKLAITASAYCQARMKLPLAVFQMLLSSVSDRLQDTCLWDIARSLWMVRVSRCRTQPHCKLSSDNRACNAPVVGFPSHT